MTGRALIDSNVLVYAFDPADRRKQQAALTLLDGLAAVQRGALSTQILGEFFRVTTEKLTRRLSRAAAQREVILLAAGWPVMPITSHVVLEAARGAVAHGMPYWDAQLWATARLNQLEVLLSEDFQDGRVIDGVRFVNPFVPSFDLAGLLG